MSRVGGRFYEDNVRAEIAARDYEARRARGDLVHLRKARQKEFVNSEATLSFSEDGLLRFGDMVQLTIALEGKTYVLSNSIFQAVSPGAIRVSAAPGPAGPVARNTFVLLPPAPSPAAARAAGATGRLGASGASAMGFSAAGSYDEGDGVLRYGSKVLLGANPALCVDTATGAQGLQYLLYSQHMNNLIGSGRKGRQEAVMTTKRDTNAEWVLAPADGDLLVSGGLPVRVGEPLQLIHANTNAPLAALAGDTVVTDVGGVELDVHAKAYRPAAHVSMSNTGEVPAAAALPPNLWAFVAADKPGMTATAAALAAAAASSRPSTSASRGAASTSRLAAGAATMARATLTGSLAAPALSVEELLGRAREQIGTRAGLHGLRSLSLAFAALDGTGTGRLPRDLVRAAMFEHGVTLEADAFALLLDAFDPEARGFLSFHELLGGLRGDVHSGARSGAVEEAYAALSAKAAKKGSKVTHGFLVAAYDPKFDPRVATEPGAVGLLTALEARNEFGRQWPRHHKASDVVTAGDFADYYADVSPLIDEDWTFMDMVANLWHVPGRGSWRRLASKRAVVTFHKGTVLEVIIPEAELVADDDFVTLSRLLQKQGLGGIARIKVTGLVTDDDE